MLLSWHVVYTYKLTKFKMIPLIWIPAYSATPSFLQVLSRFIPYLLSASFSCIHVEVLCMSAVSSAYLKKSYLRIYFRVHIWTRKIKPCNSVFFLKNGVLEWFFFRTNITDTLRSGNYNKTDTLIPRNLKNIFDILSGFDLYIGENCGCFWSSQNLFRQKVVKKWYLPDRPLPTW